jgi:superfamily II DNA/RNA helicase
MALGGLMGDLKCYACIGGTSVHDDKRLLKEGQHVVTGTPGRLYDMINRRCLQTEKIKLLVLDGADALLGLTFLNQMRDVYWKLSPKTQVVFNFLSRKKMLRQSETANGSLKILSRSSSRMKGRHLNVFKCRLFIPPRHRHLLMLLKHRYPPTQKKILKTMR